MQEVLDEFEIVINDVSGVDCKSANLHAYASQVLRRAIDGAQ